MLRTAISAYFDHAAALGVGYLAGVAAGCLAYGPAAADRGVGAAACGWAGYLFLYALRWGGRG